MTIDQNKSLPCGNDPLELAPKRCAVQEPKAADLCRACLPKPQIVLIKPAEIR